MYVQLVQGELQPTGQSVNSRGLTKTPEGPRLLCTSAVGTTDRPQQVALQVMFLQAVHVPAFSQVEPL
ncbi:hypothetical protein [Promicromonospora sp. NPDC060271]|uniref:hypothetical protein n=1 Tax=Promicromonospora sp. NPDC060271 TaxID=3347089 RepID=UPI00364D91AF